LSVPIRPSASVPSTRLCGVTRQRRKISPRVSAELAEADQALALQLAAIDRMLSDQNTVRCKRNGERQARREPCRLMAGSDQEEPNRVRSGQVTQAQDSVRSRLQ
jgi:hypothetical protein